MNKMLTRFSGKARAPENGGAGSEVELADTPRRKSVVPLWRRRSTVAMGALCGVFLLAGAATWAVQSGWTQSTFTQAKWAMIKRSAEQGFTVEDVLVTGRGETDRTALLDALGVARGAPILAYDFEAAKTRVEDLPWVFSARIERLLPDTLAVHLLERRPMALLQSPGPFALIDAGGAVIPTRRSGAVFSSDPCGRRGRAGKCGRIAGTAGNAAGLERKGNRGRARWWAAMGFDVGGRY